jgi:hypothetical protein
MSSPATPTMEELLAVYAKKKAEIERRRQRYNTEEGKENNRRKAKLHYQRHREEVLLKRKLRKEKLNSLSQEKIEEKN